MHLATRMVSTVIIHSFYVKRKKKEYIKFHSIFNSYAQPSSERAVRGVRWLHTRRPYANANRSDADRGRTGSHVCFGSDLVSTRSQTLKEKNKNTTCSYTGTQLATSKGAIKPTIQCNEAGVHVHYLGHHAH